MSISSKLILVSWAYEYYFWVYILLDNFSAEFRASQIYFSNFLPFQQTHHISATYLNWQFIQGRIRWFCIPSSSFTDELISEVTSLAWSSKRVNVSCNSSSTCCEHFALVYCTDLFNFSFACSLNYSLIPCICSFIGTWHVKLPELMPK